MHSYLLSAERFQEETEAIILPNITDGKAVNSAKKHGPTPTEYSRTKESRSNMSASKDRELRKIPFWL